MPGLDESISRDISPPTHSLMSDGIVPEQVKKFLFTSRKTQDNVQCNESLEIYIPEVIRLSNRASIDKVLVNPICAYATGITSFWLCAVPLKYF